MQCQGMYGSVQFLYEGIVYHTVPGEQALAFKLAGYQGDFEMGLRSGWYIMHMTFVDHFNEFGTKLAQFFPNDLLDACVLIHNPYYGIYCKGINRLFLGINGQPGFFALFAGEPRFTAHGIHSTGDNHQHAHKGCNVGHFGPDHKAKNGAEHNG